MNSFTQRVWEEVRRRREFTRKEIQEALDILPGVVWEVLCALRGFGCVMCHDANYIKPEARWRLTNDIGPLAPRPATFTFMLNPNTGKVIGDTQAALDRLREIGICDFLMDMQPVPRAESVEGLGARF